jgi:hypothetical protein
MKDIIIIWALLLSALASYSQPEATINDSVPLVSFRQVNQMLFLFREKVKDKLTLKEFDELTQQINQLLNEAYADYQRRKKMKKDGN